MRGLIGGTTVTGHLCSAFYTPRTACQKCPTPARWRGRSPEPTRKTPSGPAWNTRGRRPGNGPGPRVHEDGTVTLQSGRSRSTHIILCRFDDLDLVAEFDRGEKVTSTGTVESANRGKDRMGRARLKGCRATAGERR